MNAIAAGKIEVFAIESRITEAFIRPGLRGLGYFVIYLLGRQYGVRSPRATMLACSFDEVKRRSISRSEHTAPFSQSAGAVQIASAFEEVIYCAENENDLFLNMSRSELHKLIYSHKLLWAPDGDAAFDDSSRIIHFDVEDRVRLIGFQAARSSSAPLFAPNSLREVWLDAGEFYGILDKWAADFEAEWSLLVGAEERPSRYRDRQKASDEHEN